MKKPGKIPLLNFEAFIGNDLLLEAEKLFDEGKLSNLNTVKNGIWEGTIKHKKEEQIIVKVFNDFIENAQCTCGTKNLDQLCVHVVCGYFGIRNSDVPVIPEETVKKISRKKRSSALNSLLKLTDKEELADYISSYASKDRRFSLLLKTHFARKFSEVLGQEIYSQLMDQAFPAVSEFNTQSISKNQQFLVAVAKEILIHYEDAISLEQYTDAFLMINSLLQKIAYALHLKDVPYKPLSELQLEAHYQYSLLLNDKLAPALKEDIMEAMIDTVDKTFYHYTDKHNLYVLILSKITSIEQLNRFKQVLQHKHESSNVFSLRVKILAHYIKACHLTQEDLKNNEWLNHRLTDQFVLLETVENLMENNYFDETKFVLDALQNQKIIDDNSYYKLLLKLHFKLNNRSKIISISMFLFESTFDLQYVKKIKEFVGSDWTKYYKNVIQKLIESKNDMAFKAALKLSSKEKDFGTLMHLLEIKNDLDLYLKYDHFLVPEFNQKISAFYENYLFGFHTDHAGLIAVNKTIFILEHLDSIGMKKESHSLLNNVLKKFPERKSLQTSLK